MKIGLIALFAVIGLSMILVGCDKPSPKYWQPKQVVADFNKDGRSDLLEVVGVGRDLWSGQLPLYYQVSISINSDSGFQEPLPVLRIPHNLELIREIKPIDVNGDGIVDLLYQIDVGKDLWSGKLPLYYLIMVAYGNGDGTFKAAVVLQKKEYRG